MSLAALTWLTVTVYHHLRDSILCRPNTRLAG